ncbi:MAG: Nif3-like dinuclear metal center hexameric protein, partial [Oscillospiraceae bacterium]
GISLISMHTNLDAASGGVNDTLCETLELLNVHGFSPIEDYGYEARFGTLSSPVTADGFAEFIKEKLGGTVKYIDGGQKIKTVCVCSGSGGSLLREAVATGAEAFVTGDVKHSVFLEAQRNKISLFDAGHWNTENIIIDKLSQLLRENFSQVNVLPFCHKSIKFC